jgi:hypothetical protein
MNLTYEYENYEIKINKMSDSVYIEFYDNKLYKTFSNTFLDTDIVTITGKSIDTFYTVMNTVFSALIDKDFDKSILNIILFNKQIKLDIHHKYYIDIKFELELNLNKENSLNDKNICLKKLEDKIKLLEIKNDQLTEYIDDLKEFINNNIQLNIKDCSSNVTLICINQIEIDIYWHRHGSKVIGTRYENINGMNKLILDCHGLFPNSRFKNVKCESLKIISIDDYKLPFFLPLSLKKLIIKDCLSILSFELPNLINLELIDCTFELIYENISHLKTLKNITIQRCNNFKERELLISKGYNIQMLA